MAKKNEFDQFIEKWKKKMTKFDEKVDESKKEMLEHQKISL